MSHRSEIERILHRTIGTMHGMSPVLLSHIALALDGKLRLAAVEARFALQQHVPFADVAKNMIRFPVLGLINAKLSEVDELAGASSIREMSKDLVDLRTKLAHVAARGSGGTDDAALARFVLWLLLRMSSPQLSGTEVEVVAGRLVEDAAGGILPDAVDSLEDVLCRLLSGREFQWGFAAGFGRRLSETKEGKNG